MKLIEVHIAAPVMGEEKVTAMRQVLTAVGLPKTKYFQGVRDYKPITEGCTNGHDLSDPGTMSTVKVETIEEAVRLVRIGMEKLKEIGIENTNFEIEQVLTGTETAELTQPVTPELESFQEIPNAPQSENHILYKGTAAEIPTDVEIQQMSQQIGLEVNQIVDFTHDATVSPQTVISRVATFYQPTQLAAIVTDQLLKKHRDQLKNPRIVTERVLMVGEFRK